MKIIKPLRISPLTRLYRMHGEERLGIAAMMVATLGDAPQLLMDTELWSLAGEELGDYTLDMALPKAHPEFLVSGYAYGKYAYARGSGACEVGVHLNGVEKRLRVSGDRQWDGSRITAPQPFERLKLDWDLAYGGAGYADNPRGRGIATTGEDVHPLPNIESPHDPMRFRDQRPAPAGFCPVDAAWPQRASLYGEPDRQWLEEDFPGFPRSLDPRYFNIAPVDQQWIEQAEWPDGAAYELAHLHPDHALLTGRLPALRARSFIVRAGSDTPEEIPLRLTTAWFIPHRERVLMIYHGVTTVREFDASDVEALLFGADASGQPRPADWYRQVIDWRTRHEKAALYALRDQDLLPERYLSPGFPGMSGAASQSVRQQILKDKLSAFPEARQIEEPRPDQLIEFVERQEAEAEAQRAHLEKMREEDSANEAIEKAARRGPPERIAVPDDGAGSANRSRMQQMQHDADESLRKLYLQSAHHQEAPERLSTAASRSHRERVAAAIATGQSLEGADLTGVDLSGMDLRGAKLSGAMLENANLSDTDLTSAALNHAVLVRADLSRATFCNADLKGANLSLAACDQTDFAGANLSDCIVERVQLHDCRLSGGVLDNTRFSECRFHAVDFSHATLRNLIFIEQSFDDVNFSSATIRKMLLMNCSIVDVRFTSADIEGFGIVDTQAKGQLRFDRASVVKACFIQRCDIGGADFSCAMLNEVNFRETHLGGADFSGAHISNCDFTDACLSAAQLRGAKVEGGNLVRTDFTQADLRDADLIGAFMRRATLDGADLRRANLFRANLAQILTDDDTRWEDAYLNKAMRYPMAEPRK
ncbi:DUF2169 family type VI secretion system accessory protein [Burkholderia ubonensis]|uniref:DUF2169 domain-containing protein n=1 Tax=Burkholderia ubonensis subsp. mesacidophila TaxID=265293 RepID=A0A2A4FD72_9BURK|nr:DUF2169 domain-containing protein [Burkholderia ubonensis]PCE30622.1 hypothetical protein BZL54_19835 [Burkholderia ubonensis subsp. mesacidophila]